MTVERSLGEHAVSTDPDAIHAATGTGNELVLRRDGGIARLTLNRAEKRNALTAEMSWGLARVLRVLSEDATVRACVITGEGPAFCAGGDVGGFPVKGQQGAQADGRTQPDGGARDTPVYRPARGEVYPAAAIRDCPFPVIAAVNGPAAGAGFSLALACDLAIADPTARFGALQVSRGLVADWALAWLLVRRIGVSRAQDLIWSGRWLSAEDALHLGLVNRLSAPGAALDEALTWAAELAKGPAVAISLMKRQAQRALEMSLEQALELDSLMQARAFTTSDAAEGARAFRERRQPEFGAS
jgi:2-(1,2-epoxy-1,2-dihydrophenyl)acetyl-CoA isomerase